MYLHRMSTAYPSPSKKKQYIKQKVQNTCLSLSLVQVVWTLKPFPDATGEYSIFPNISNHRSVLPTDGNQIGLQSDRTKNTLPRVLHDIWYMND